MKKFIGILALGGFLASGTASAQLDIPLPGIGGIEGGILGVVVNDVVPGLVESLTTLDLKPTIDALAGPGGQSGLIRGDSAVGVNLLLTGLLAPPLSDVESALGGVQLVVTGLVDGLGRSLLGEGILGGAIPGLEGLPVLGDLLGGGLLGGEGGIPIVGGLLGGAGGIPIVGGLLGGAGGIPIIGGLLGGEGGIPIVGGLLGGEGGIPIIGGLLGGEGGIPIIGGLLGGAGGIPIIGGLLGGAGGIPIIGGLLGGEGGIPIVGGLLGGEGGLPVVGPLLAGGLLTGDGLFLLGSGDGLLPLGSLPLDVLSDGIQSGVLSGVSLPGLDGA